VIPSLADRGRPAALLALALPALLAACDGAGDADDDSAAPTTGTLSLSFSVTAGSRESPNLEDPLVGDIRGSLFLTEEVGLMGPDDGAEAYGDIEILGVDLQVVDPSTETWTSGPLDPGEYTFLGFFDLDGNGTVDYEPDPGDPATLSTTNHFPVTAGEDTAGVVLFDLVL